MTGEASFLVAQPFQAVPKIPHRLESLCYQNQTCATKTKARRSGWQIF